MQLFHRSRRRRTWSASLAASLVLSASASVLAQTQPANEAQPAQPEAPATGQPTDQPVEEPAAPAPVEPAPPAAVPAPAAPEAPPPAVTFPSMGPTRELNLSENFFIRPGIQLQHWTELLQDRTKQVNGDDGKYQMNTFIRRARIF